MVPQEDLVKVAADLRTEVDRAAGAVREASAATMASLRSHHAMQRDLKRPVPSTLDEPTPMPGDAPPSAHESRLATALLVLAALVMVGLLFAMAWNRPL